MPSAIDYDFIDYPLHELSDVEIRKIIKDFGDAAKRAVKCGFDGIEIHGANHYLIQQFFSRYSNHRTDQWGGSLENRMRFPLAVTKEVFKAVKEANAPEDFIIGYRISPEEYHRGPGYTWQESTQLIKQLTNNYDFDYIHLSLPKYDKKPNDSDKTFAELFRPAIGNQAKEVIVGDVMDEQTAQDALQYTDLVAMARATLIDPEIGKKITEGRGDEIINEISPAQIKKARLTPGLVQIFSDPMMEPHLPGRETIYNLHEGGKLDKSVIKNGTDADYNLDDLKN